MRSALPLLFALLCLAGCRTYDSEGSGYESWSAAAQHMATADTLERTQSLGRAALEYSLVAQLYPSSEFYPVAVRKAALLSSDPRNPGRSDSVSSYWFGQYLELPLSSEERELVNHFIKVKEEARAARGGFARQGAVSDSLQVVVRRQGNDVGGKAKRIQELEAELAKANEELKKLREIDVKMQRTKEK